MFCAYFLKRGLLIGSHIIHPGVQTSEPIVFIGSLCNCHNLIGFHYSKTTSMYPGVPESRKVGIFSCLFLAETPECNDCVTTLRQLTLRVAATVAVVRL